jgi:hypothetical protein
MNSSQILAQAIKLRKSKVAQGGIVPVVGQRADFSKWQSDPVAFGMEVLGEHYTDPIKEVIYSVRDNPVTMRRARLIVRPESHCGFIFAIPMPRCTRLPRHQNETYARYYGGR